MNFLQMLAKENPPPAPEPPKALAPAPEGFLGRQDRTEPIPMDFHPPDDAPFAQGNELGVVINDAGEGYLAVLRPGKQPLYLIGPLKSLQLPF